MHVPFQYPLHERQKQLSGKMSFVFVGVFPFSAIENRGTHSSIF